MQVIAAKIAGTSQRDPLFSPDTIKPTTEILNTTVPTIYTFAHLFANNNAPPILNVREML